MTKNTLFWVWVLDWEEEKSLKFSVHAELPFSQCIYILLEILVDNNCHLSCESRIQANYC